MYDDLLTVLSPERADEKKFEIPFDDDQTRAIPIISEASKFEQVEATKKIEPIVVEPPQAPPKKRKKWPLVVGGMAGILILAPLGFLLPGLLGPKQGCIPDVSEKEETEALSMLEEEGFKVEETIEQTSDEFEAGLPFGRFRKREEKGCRIFGHVIYQYGERKD